MFKNKHTVVAMLVAPVLAIGAYFAIDRLVGEQAHAAEAGRGYPLVEMPNCRYDSGQCGLKNEDFKLDLKVEWLGEERIRLSLKSAFPLTGATVAVALTQADQPLPTVMQGMDEEGLEWSVELDCPDPETNRLRLVASAQGAMYFADAAMKFALKGR